MKKKLIYFVMSLSLALTVTAMPIAVQAATVTATNQTKDSVASTTTMEHSTNSTTETESSDDVAGRPARIEAYKKDLKESLPAAAKLRITERCIAAQGVLKGRVTNNGKSYTARTAAYEMIISKLQEVVTTASGSGAKVSELQANIATLQTKILAFKTANTLYQQALNDAGAVDCKTDPTGFKAALEAARTDRLTVFTSAQDIRTYVNETIKVTLKSLKTKSNS